MTDKPVVVVLLTNGELTFTAMESSSVDTGGTEPSQGTTRPARGAILTGGGRGSGEERWRDASNGRVISIRLIIFLVRYFCPAWVSCLNQEFDLYSTFGDVLT